MPANRLIPKTDDGTVPYDAALKLLLELTDAKVEPKDFAPLIAAGRRMRWTQKMIRDNEDLAARGKCFDFNWVAEDGTNISGTLFENNIFFSVVDGASVSKIGGKLSPVELREQEGGEFQWARGAHC